MLCFAAMPPRGSPGVGRWASELIREEQHADQERNDWFPLRRNPEIALARGMPDVRASNHAASGVCRDPSAASALAQPPTARIGPRPRVAAKRRGGGRGMCFQKMCASEVARNAMRRRRSSR